MSNRLQRSPTVHILLLGALVAAALYLARGPATGEGEQRVFISDADVVQVRAVFMRTWQREPTPAELRGLIDSLIREEVLYEEALARGYDDDDPTVRRAMQRKMEFLGEAQVDPAALTEEEVRAYLTLRQDRYRVPAQMSFVQVYFSPDRRGEGVEADAADALAELRRLDPPQADLADWGDGLMLRDRFVRETEAGIARELGAEFAAAVAQLQPGEWQGPIASAYGLHLVKVTSREEGGAPEFEAVAARVIEDMSYEARQAAVEQFYQEILQRYEVGLGDLAAQLLEARTP